MRYSAILAAALIAGAATPAFAATPQATTSLVVKYADLDLATRDGQEQLERRIDRAARAACGIDDVRTGSRLPSADAKRCFEEARANVHQQVAKLIARDKSSG